MLRVLETRPSKYLPIAVAELVAPFVLPDILPLSTLIGGARMAKV